MNLYCVDCGKRNIPEKDWHIYRCRPCWLAFKAAGGIRRDTAPIVESPSGIKTGGQPVFANYAKHCRQCGNEICPRGILTKRAHHALLRGSECMKCDDCHYEKHPREILRAPRQRPPRHSL